MKEEIEVLKQKLKDAQEYINFVYVFKQTIEGKLNKTIWGEELLDILKYDDLEREE